VQPLSASSGHFRETTLIVNGLVFKPLAGTTSDVGLLEKYMSRIKPMGPLELKHRGEAQPDALVGTGAVGA
jgi:hypothetical protein